MLEWFRLTSKGDSVRSTDTQGISNDENVICAS